MRAGVPIDVATLNSIGNIDRQTVSGLLSDTLMSGARTKFLVAVSLPSRMGRKVMFTRFAARVAAIALLLVLCGNTVYAGQQKPKRHELRHEIEQLEEAWTNAIIKSDTAALSALLADDYIAITASGTLQTKDEALASLRTHRVHFTAINVSDRKLRFYGKTALVTSQADVQGTTPDGDLTESFRYTRVYVLNSDGQWKIVSFEASRIRQ